VLASAAPVNPISHQAFSPFTIFLIAAFCGPGGGTETLLFGIVAFTQCPLSNILIYVPSMGTTPRCGGQPLNQCVSGAVSSEIKSRSVKLTSALYTVMRTLEPSSCCHA
jgi:hypothetical protein